MGCCQKKKPEKLIEQPLNQNKDELLNVEESMSKEEEDNNLNFKLTYDDFTPLK